MASPTSNHPLPPPKGPPPPQHQQQQQQPFPQYQEQLPSSPAQRFSHQLPPPPQQQQQPQQYQQPSYQRQLPQQYPPSFPQQPHQQLPRQQQPPPNPQQQQARPGEGKTRPRNFSFRSDKSQKSAGGQPGALVETHAEKEAKRLHSKADPTLAMNEAEPSAVAASVKPSLASLRSTSHRDAFGNPIADPDRSNPTRSRWERPLDTIRSFEAAIDGGYDRKSFIRSESDSIANWNRRSSYYGNNPGRVPPDGTVGRPNSAFMHSSSHFDLRQGTPGRDSYYDQHSPAQPGPSHQNNAYNNAYGNAYGNGPPNGPPNGRQRYSRMASEPHFRSVYNQGEQNVYPVPNNGRSYETVASGSGSGTSAEPAGYQTDPTSSDNSSIERVQSPPKRQPESTNDYGIGFSQSPTYQPPAFTVGVRGQGPRSPIPPGHPAHPQQNPMGAPPVPRKDAGGNTILRKPTAPPVSMHTQQPQQRPAMAEKRKSWFSRRFSKQG